MTSLYGLVGYPLGHSFSRAFFSQKFARENIDASYRNFELEFINMLMPMIDSYPALAGFNVTIPYKEAVLPLLDYIDPVAQAIGAVNVVKVIRRGAHTRLCGFNSDIVGFTESIRPMLAGISRKTALVLGTGGASKAVVAGLRALGLEPLTVSRRQSAGSMTYADINANVMTRCGVIVNTTPLGMHPHIDTCPDIPYNLITPSHLCYDLVYNPSETLFMSQAAARGALTSNGLDMLHKQAIEAWRIWTINEVI